MKRIVTLLLGFIILLFVHSVHGQVESNSQELTENISEEKFEVPEGYHVCDPSVPLEKACFTKLPETERPVEDVIAEAKSSNDPFACQPRPLRAMIVYDRVLLDSYDSLYLDTTIRNNAARFIAGFDNSKISHNGVKLWIQSWDIPEDYNSIFQVNSMLASPSDGKLDSLLVIKNDYLDIDLLTVLTKENVAGSGVANQVTTQFFNWKVALSTVNFANVRVNSVTYSHECFHRLGCGHEGNEGNGVDFDAQAYINDSLSIHSIMKFTNILSQERDLLSGPDSWLVMPNGDSVHFTDGYINNAKYAEMFLEAYWCDNKVTQVLIDTPLCGNGQLRAITNNADSFIWQVVSGDIDLQAENDTLVDYLAHEESVVRVIAQKTGKLYADTAYMTVPARQEVVIDTMMTRGDTLSDGTVVDQSGTYLVTGFDENGCEVIYTYNVELSTATRTLQQVGISLYPNPTSNYIVIHGLSDAERIEIINVNGKLLKEINNPSNRIDVWDIPNGLYIIKVFSKPEGLLIGKLIVDRQE